MLSFVYFICISWSTMQFHNNLFFYFYSILGKMNTSSAEWVVVNQLWLIFNNVDALWSVPSAKWKMKID